MRRGLVNLCLVLLFSVVGATEAAAAVTVSRGGTLDVAGTAAWNGSLGPFPIIPIEAMSARLADKMLDANKRPR